MLYLMRKLDESIMINENIELKIMKIKGKSVKLGFVFPEGSSVLRKELFERIQQEKNGEKLPRLFLKKKVISS